MIPVLKGERVVLRGQTWADFPAFAEMWADPDLQPFIPFAPVEPSISWGRANINDHRWCRDGFGNWAVVDHNGVYLGVTGFFRNPKAGMGAEYDAGIQSGWVFSKAARGRGIATEAVQLAHDWMDRQPFGGVTYCGMDPENLGSARVAEKVGYTFFERVEDHWGVANTMKRAI